MIKLFSIDNEVFLNRIQNSEAQLNKFLSENWALFFPQYIFIKSEFPLAGNVRTSGNSGRIDIFAFNSTTNKFVVFELKRDLSRNIRDQAGDYRDRIIGNFHEIYLLCTDDYGVELPKYKTIIQDSIEIVLVSKSFSPTDVEKVNKFKNDNDITLIKYLWFESQLLLIEYLNNEPPDLLTEKIIKPLKKINQEENNPNIFLKPTTDADKILYINNKKGVKASGYLQTDGQFMVLAGSTISENISQKSTPKNAIKERENCEKKEVIRDGVFIEDYPFNSISLAAEVILGGSLNGNNVWKKNSQLRKNV